MKTALILALATTGFAFAQPQTPYQEQQQQLPPQPQQQYPGTYSEPRRGDLTALLGAMTQAMNGLRRLNDINNLPPEMQNTDQNRTSPAPIRQDPHGR